MSSIGRDTASQPTSTGQGLPHPLVGSDVVERRVDLAIAAIVMAIGVLLLFQAAGIDSGAVSDPVGTAGLTRASAVVMVGGGAIVVYQWLQQARHASAANIDDELAAQRAELHQGSSVRALGIGAMSFAYVVVLSTLGFLVITPLFIAAALWIMKIREVKSLIVLSLSSTIVIYLIFVSLFQVLLPLGPLSDYSQILWFRLF